MLKEVLASNAAKLVAACVCPVVGASAVALKVPQVRAAVHKATAPKAKPEREKRTEPPGRPADEATKLEPVLQAAMLCPPPVVLQSASIEPRTSAALTLAPAPMRIVESRPPERIFVSTPCASVPTMGSAMGTRIAAVPEPAAWAQMIAGFALTGAALRSSRPRRALRRA